jgi:antirestriction protein ArdC
MKKEQSEEIALKFIAQLEQGVVPWKKPWSPCLGVPLRNHKSKRAYRGINTLILGLEQMIHGYESPEWTTYKAASEMGGQVRKGEKGTHIVFWKPMKVEDKESGKEKSVLLARLYTVFCTDQIDGIDWVAPEPNGEPIAVPDALASIYHGYKDGPKLSHRQQDKAYYRPSTDEVVLPMLDQFSTLEGYAETYCHELTHSTGHASRLNRFEIGDNYHQQYAKEELVAEIGASMLMQQAGINPDMPQMASYVGGWLKALNNDHSLIVKAAQAAQKSCDRILGNSYAEVEAEQQEVSA